GRIPVSLPETRPAAFEMSELIAYWRTPQPAGNAGHQAARHDTGVAREYPAGLPHGDRNDVRHDLPTCTQGVAAEHVDRDELRVPFISGYASVAGVACRADFLGVSFEVLGADSRATPDLSALPDFSRPYPQDEREPPGTGVEPCLPAQFLEAVPGYQAPEPARVVPA